MIEKVALLWPEIALFVTTCVVMTLGLSPNARARKLVPWITGLGLAVAGVIGISSPSVPGAMFPEWIPFVKTMIAGVGLMTLLLMVGTVDRALEARLTRGEGEYSPLHATRAEFYSFFLFSLTGLMLCATADDLIWLFLALELTSLPTYMMVTVSTRTNRSQEAGVKYFYLGALGAAVILYGFSLLYGATGTTSFVGMADALAASGSLSTLAIAGLLLSVIGALFKIAAVPMHFYTPDVYEGAASPVSAMLAFVPKTAGFLTLMILAGVVGWRLPDSMHWTLWIVAALTMTVGNVMAWMQTSVKRMLAYSSIAHSGYMLVGLLAGPGEEGAPFYESGLAAVFFYLLAYGVTNIGAFGVIACLERRTGEEADSIDELRGLCSRSPLLGWSMVVCVLSLMGLPPLLGFVGKLGLFTSGVSAGLLPLVVILGINSAIAAFYYLRIVQAVALEKPEDDDAGFEIGDIKARWLAALLSATGAVTLIVFAQPIAERALSATAYSIETPSRELAPASDDDARADASAD